MVPVCTNRSSQECTSIPQYTVHTESYSVYNLSCPKTRAAWNGLNTEWLIEQTCHRYCQLHNKLPEGPHMWFPSYQYDNQEDSTESPTSYHSVDTSFNMSQIACLICSCLSDSLCEVAIRCDTKWYKQWRIVKVQRYLNLHGELSSALWEWRSIKGHVPAKSLVAGQPPWSMASSDKLVTS
jgi:hypothetical protein